LDEDGNLVISMEKKTENNEKKEGRYLRREFSYSKFQQAMILPDNVDKESINAKVDNGVLNIIIPKKAEDKTQNAGKVIEIS
ncbi:MAG: Hsp20/alpha crystallin family protein, partial [Massilibacteroides sp.]|nr:Hsp20/alpha crystallin family protein [Massilibacteroides sp.]